MGILDSFKKAMSGNSETVADEVDAAAVEPAPARAGGESAQPGSTLPVKPGTVSAEQGSYTVRSGDTLWNIAESVYGDGSKYLKIFDANTDLLEQPDQIFPGQKLLIPDPDD